MSDLPSDLQGRRCLVTGSGGFIGSHLVDALVAAGADVRAFVRYTSRGTRGWLDERYGDGSSTIEFVAGDLRDATTVDRAAAGCDVILHLGALIAIPYSYETPEAYVATNVVGTLNVLEAARRHGVSRVVHVSTSEVYGTAQAVPITEEHPIRPQSPYAASKAAADHLALSYWSAFDTPVVVVRPFNTYGPRQSLRAVIPTIAAQLMAGGVVRLGATTPTRDFTYVSDTVEALVRATVAPGVEGATVQLGTGREISIGDLAARLAVIVGTPLEIETEAERLRPPASEVERLVSGPQRAERLLGWHARVSLDEGLARTVQWLRTTELPTASSRYVK